MLFSCSYSSRIFHSVAHDLSSSMSCKPLDHRIFSGHVPPHCSTRHRDLIPILGVSEVTYSESRFECFEILWCAIWGARALCVISWSDVNVSTTKVHSDNIIFIHLYEAVCISSCDRSHQGVSPKYHHRIIIVKYNLITIISKLSSPPRVLHEKEVYYDEFSTTIIHARPGSLTRHLQVPSGQEALKYFT